VAGLIIAPFLLTRALAGGDPVGSSHVIIRVLTELALAQACNHSRRPPENPSMADQSFDGQA